MNIDQPSGVFGQRRREIRAPATLADRTARPIHRAGQIQIMCLIGLASLLLTVTGACFWMLPAIEKLDAEAARAEQRVVEIVNRPITHLARSGPVSVFSPGWFHPGATKPDFNNVDVRATQELTYEGHVTSDLNPSEMFNGRELEFNAMTKYFYTDRTLPKKRLFATEMVEINGLYRVVGHDEQAVLMRWLAIIGLVVVGFALGSALLLLINRTRRLTAG